ncbi:hypothetical protein SAY86_009134 [Trapa natans]|uniref:RRM domain-containing protein n=1 Tax=Trapa natans TaxID=22666 RepID=A0AAN7QBV4_TRANT|nr:hypothetical protein SAY86_009134 [Trapa natans]
MAGFREICGTFLKPRTSLRSSFLPSQVILLRRITTRLFIKGISFSSTELTFKEAFSKYGEVLEASIIRDKDKGRSKGYGYVTFATSHDAIKALDDMNGKLMDGRVVFVDLARPRRRMDSCMPISSGKPEPVESAAAE